MRGADSHATREDGAPPRKLRVAHDQTTSGKRRLKMSPVPYLERLIITVLNASPGKQELNFATSSASATEVFKSLEDCTGITGEGEEFPTAVRARGREAQGRVIVLEAALFLTSCCLRCCAVLCCAGLCCMSCVDAACNRRYDTVRARRSSPRFLWSKWNSNHGRLRLRTLRFRSHGLLFVKFGTPYFCTSKYSGWSFLHLLLRMISTPYLFSDPNLSTSYRHCCKRLTRVTTVGLLCVTTSAVASAPRGRHCALRLWV